MAALRALVGSKLSAVRYVQLATEKGPARWTLAPDFHSVDVAVEFQADHKSAVVYWRFDARTADHGLITQAGSLEHSDAALAVDVSGADPWTRLIGLPFSLVAEARWKRDAKHQEFPSAAIIRLSGDQFVAVAAAEYDVNRGALLKGADGITIFFDPRVAEAHGLVTS